jgi:hypothetical protein
LPDPKLERLLRYWDGQGLRLAEVPASVQDILRFERESDLRLPADFRQYLLEVNGMNFREWPQFQDNDGFYFWPLEVIEDHRANLTPVQVHYLGGPGVAATRVVFADYFQWSWAFAVESGPAPARGAVWMVGAGDAPVRISDSFLGFVDVYISGSPILRGG